jgi:predicted nuclease of predicted toxin-antitoxin system
MARFIVDEALPRSLADAIRAAGHEAVHIREIGLQGSSDAVVFDYAQGQGAVLVTPDLEFGDIREFPPGQHCGVVLLRMPRISTPPRLASEVVRLLRGLTQTDLEGNLIIMEPGHVRIRRSSL